MTVESLSNSSRRTTPPAGLDEDRVNYNPKSDLCVNFGIIRIDLGSNRLGRLRPRNIWHIDMDA
jgi:hypothetical protein